MPSVPFARALQSASQLFKQLSTIRPKEAKMTVGLDIGSTSVKVIALGPRKGFGPRPILGQNLVALAPGQEADPSEAIKDAIRGLSLPVHTVNLSVSGQWVIMRIVEMPTMKSTEMRQALSFEAQRYVPFNIQDVIVDGAVLGPADANKSWVLIVACKKELIERRVDWAKRAGVEVALIDVDALSLANGFLMAGNGQRIEGTRVLLNVGAQLTNVVIFQGDIPYLVRDIPWGGEKLIRGSAEQAGLDVIEVGKRIVQGDVNADLLNAMKLASEPLATELQLSCDYFENRFGHPPDELLVSGGVSRSSAFLEALKGHFSQTVTSWVPLEGLSGQFTVAYGLALRTN